MNVVVIGDVGWWDLYHLGDEAMTEAALQMLAARDVNEITVIGGQADVTTRLYGYPSVARIGFRGAWNREKHETTLTAVDDVLAGKTTAFPALAGVIDAVRAADAVLIAGGGNMNSDHVNHLYERLALTRIARQFSVPVFVVSQTVGPHLIDRDRSMVKEILEYASCFGAREAQTYKLLVELSGDGGTKVSHTMDDAMMLAPDDSDMNALASLRLSERYLVGSFTSHSGTSGLGAEEYYDGLAKTLDELAAALDADVALVPHAGSLDRSVRKGDQLANDRILAASRSGRIVHTDMLTARQAIALTRGAQLSLSTRYHPTVFSPAVGTPALGVAISYYSSVRMRGANENIGLEGFVLPTASWRVGTVERAAAAILGEDRERVISHIAETSRLRREEQNAWWDAIVEAMGTRKAPANRVLKAVPTLGDMSWSGGLDATTLASDELGQARVAYKHLEARNTRLERSADSAQEEAQRLRAVIDERDAKIKTLSSDLKASRNRLSARVANKLSALARFGRR